MNVTDVLNDLLAEQQQLDDIVAPLDGDSWLLDTPSAGWTIADQIGHLAYFDRSAALAISDPSGFIAHRDELLAQMADGSADLDGQLLGPFRDLDSSQQLAEWRSARGALESAATSLDDHSRVEWYGPSMGAKSFLTARLMEVWAHGQDVVDTLNRNGQPVERSDSDRLRHIAQLGVITRGWSYAVRRLDPPDVPVRVELTAPSGEQWAWGESDAAESIVGDAADFCRVVTQRRHIDDTSLTTTDGAARDWMLHAQAFAGSPTDGPAAGQW